MFQHQQYIGKIFLEMEVFPKFEPKAGSVNNYEVTKVLKRVPGLKRKELAEAKKLGAFEKFAA